MLSMNNMLTTGGNRQHTRRSVRVSEPSYGFFITGSSIEHLNGVYVRQNAPRSAKAALPAGRLIALYYKHEEGGWSMNLDQLPAATEEEEEEESDEDDYLYRYRPKVKKPTHEWVIRDEFGKGRFTHEGDTIVPGAGVRWKHAHEQPTTSADAATAAASAGGASSTAVTEIKEDDEEELPWQVIAILDLETVQDLLYSSQYHKQKVKEAKAGKNAPAPATATLEAAAAPGRWLFRVVAPAGISLRLEADDSAAEAGSRKCGEYLRGLELGGGGDWLRLESCEDTDPRRLHNRKSNNNSSSAYFNADLSRREVWVRIASGATIFLEEVPADETAVLELTAVGDAADDSAAIDDAVNSGSLKGSSSSSAAAVLLEKATAAGGGSGLTGDFFDKPFIPRMNDGNNSNDEILLLAAAAEREADNLQVLAAVSARSAFSESLQWGVPVGAAVTVTGLKSRAGEQYNGVSGVVVSALEAASGGRQGVRLNAPFSGKLLSCKPNSLSFCADDEKYQHMDFDGSNSSSSAQSEQQRRAARLLGLSAAQLNLPALNEAITADATKTAATDADAASDCCLNLPAGWGFGGSKADVCIGTALRCLLRDHGLLTSSPTLCDNARAAAELLLAAVAGNQSSPSATDATATPEGTATTAESERAPFVMVRSGALGGRAAAAAVSAFSTLSNAERTAGIEELFDILNDEVHRSRSARDSIVENVGEDSNGRDELLLRLTLVQALLDGRREAEALEQARYAAKLYADSEMAKLIGSCPAVALLLGRCLLRLGMRADGFSALEEAPKYSAVVPATTDVGAAAIPAAADATALATDAADWLWPLWNWGAREAQQLLRVHRASEQCRDAAVETYARGSFQDAASLYSRALALLQSGLADDKRGKATALADRAGCLRRARKLDEAVEDLDAALRLFPRYTRALFRKATCLLEAGKAEAAVEGFKALYRVDRDWPMLSEWLVRAYSLRKRQAKGYRRAGEEAASDSGSDDDFNYDDPTAPRKGNKKAAAGTGVNGQSEADVIAKEVDHYTVLGVTTDATEKQLKTAYRLRSLKFHPDRKEGHTAAFQRIAEAYEVLSDEDKRRNYDEGVDIKVKRGRRDQDDDSDDSEEEHKTSMREEVEREFYPERYSFWPFGDPFIYKRKRAAQKRTREGRPAWDDED